MDDEDYVELYQHLRTELPAGLLQQVDDQVTAFNLPPDARARDLTLLALDVLETQLALMSKHTVERTVQLFQEYVRTQDHASVDDVQLVLDPATQLSTGVDVFSLLELPDRQEQVEVVRRLRADLAES
jgi:hypothetical protein